MKKTIIIKFPQLVSLGKEKIDVRCKYFEECRNTLPNMKDNQSFSCHKCPSYKKFQIEMKYVEHIKDDEDFEIRTLGNLGNGNRWILRKEI